MAAQTSTTALQAAPQTNRVSVNPSFSQRIQLPGSLPRWVTTERQVSGRTVDPEASLRISLGLRRAPSVQAAFEKLLADQQNPSSPNYHHWLTPEQIGQLYGPTESDVQAVTHWLETEGLRAGSVSADRMLVEVSGTTTTVANAFRTSFAYFELSGTERRSVTSAPFIPEELSSVIASVHGLTETQLEPQHHSIVVSGKLTSAEAESSTSDGSRLSPQLTSGSNHYLTPNDFTTIYDIGSVYSGGNTGATIGSAAQHVAIIGRSRVAAGDISQFASKTGIAKYNLNTIVASNGTDPGTTNTGDQEEATLDVDRVIGTAPGAVADLIVSGSTSGSDGVYLAAYYNVYTQKDPVMTISFGACEANAGSYGVNTWDTLFSTAAAEGMSVFVSSGDSGAAGCDASFANPPASQVRSINYICSSSYATCVGGTEFNDTSNPSAYWSSSNGAGYSSALSYIPEGAWNEPTTTQTTSGYQPASSGGGVSSYITQPSWQTGTGVPSNGYRNVPDVALSAAGHDGYYACLAFTGADCSSGSFTVFSGTSAAAPGMAGIAALLNTARGSAQGNVNPLLYKLAASSPASFHDATVASSGVTNCTASTPSTCNNSTPSSSGLSGGLAGYVLTAGYDQVTGLGSVDVAKLLAAAGGTTTTPTPTPTPTAASFNMAASSGSLYVFRMFNFSNSGTATLTSTNSFAGSVGLTCSVTRSSSSSAALPTCSASPASVALAANKSGSATVSVAASSSVPSGSYTVTVKGTSGSTAHTATFALTVY